MRLLAVTVVLFLLAAATARAAAFNAGTETTTSGALSATLAWDAGELGPAHTRLTITRAGAVVFDGPIPRVCGEHCDRTPGDTDGFQFIDLDGKGEPELYVDAFNGERCCDTVGIFEAGGGQFVLHSAASIFTDDADGDGVSELITRDGRLARPLDAGYLPRRVFRYDAGAVHDVTRQFPDLLNDDADFLLGVVRELKRHDGQARAALGAYVAEEYLLGAGGHGLKVLDHQLARGVVGGPKRSATFRRTLLALLHRTGYR